MSYYSGTSAKLVAAKQANYKANSGLTNWNLMNITSATFDPAVEKMSEETLLRNRVKNGSYLATITVDGSYSSVLRPEMADFVFETGLGVKTAGTNKNTYTLKAAGEVLDGSTYVFQKGASTFTYPAATVSSIALSCPNNDFVTCDVSLKGREQIKGTAAGAIEEGGTALYNGYAMPAQPTGFTKSSYMVVGAVFKWNNVEKCISSCNINIDNGLEDAPRCYQDGAYLGQPIVGLRAVSVDFNMPYDADLIDTLQKDYLMANTLGSIELTLKAADTADAAETLKISIPKVSITSVSAGVTGTGVIESSVSGEAVTVVGQEPISIEVNHTAPAANED